MNPYNTRWQDDDGADTPSAMSTNNRCHWHDEDGARALSLTPPARQSSFSRPNQKFRRTVVLDSTSEDEYSDRDVEQGPVPVAGVIDVDWKRKGSQEGSRSRFVMPIVPSSTSPKTSR